MAPHEIDFRTANFDEIAKFAMNLLQVDKAHLPDEYEARIAYWSTATQVVLARRAFESTEKLANQVDRAGSVLVGGLDRLEQRILAASESADGQASRIKRATWGLVVATIILSIATVGLVYYTRALVHAERESSTPLTPSSIVR